MKKQANQLAIDEQRIEDVTNAFVASHYIVSNGKGAKHERADGSGMGQFEAVIIECGPDDVRQLMADLFPDLDPYTSIFYQQALALKQGVIYVSASRLVVRSKGRKPRIAKWSICHEPAATMAAAQQMITTTRPMTAYVWKDIEQTPIATVVEVATVDQPLPTTSAMNDETLVCTCGASLIRASNPQQCICLREHAISCPRYVYQLTIRPTGPDTTPTGVGRMFHEDNPLAIGRDHGSVSYAEPLTNERITHYSLLPVTQMAALNGQVFVETWPSMLVRHAVSLSENGSAFCVISECDGVKHTQVLSWSEFTTQSKRWEPLTTCPWCEQEFLASAFEADHSGLPSCPHCGGN